MISHTGKGALPTRFISHLKESDDYGRAIKPVVCVKVEHAGNFIILDPEHIKALVSCYEKWSGHTI